MPTIESSDPHFCADLGFSGFVEASITSRHFVVYPDGGKDATPLA